jgi:hypothetical protein
VCIQLYKPVCARLPDGTEKTFSNGCTACVDPAVRGYRLGSCEPEKRRKLLENSR